MGIGKLASPKNRSRDLPYHRTVSIFIGLVFSRTEPEPVIFLLNERTEAKERRRTEVRFNLYISTEFVVSRDGKGAPLECIGPGKPVRR